MSLIAISLGPFNPSWLGYGLATAIAGFLIAMMACGAQLIAKDGKLFRFCGLLGTIALALGLVLIGTASLLPYY